jgi:hypothetical protein
MGLRFQTLSLKIEVSFNPQSLIIAACQLLLVKEGDLSRFFSAKYLLRNVLANDKITGPKIKASGPLT